MDQSTNPEAHEARPPSPPAPSKFNWQLATGAAVGLLILAAGLFPVHPKEENKKKPRALMTSSLEVRTTPPGASIRINNEVKCTSDCTLELVEGEHQIQAFLPGYEPRVSTVNLSAGVPISIDLTMEPQTMGLRVLSDLPSGKVTLDGEGVGLLQDGQLGVDRISAGKHKIELRSAKGSADFEFESSPGAAPRLTSPITAVSLFVSAMGYSEGKAYLYANEPPVIVQMDGNPMGEIGPHGLQLLNLPAGDHSFLLEEGQRLKTLKASLGSQPVLLLFVRFDPNLGGLLVKSNEDDATLFLNDNEYWQKTKKGKLEIKNLGVGPILVRLAKWQFTASPLVVKVEIKKGEQTELTFQLTRNTVAAPPNPARIELPPALRENPKPLPMPPVTPPGVIVTQGGDPFLSQWEDQTNWSEQSGWRVKKGGNFVFLAKRPVTGLLRFSLSLVKGKRLQWFAGFRDSNNFVLYQMDGKDFIRKEFVDGKSNEVKTPYELNIKGSVTVQLRISQGQIVHETLDGSAWKKIDAVSAAGRDFAAGRFGLYLPGDDAFAVSNFYYSGK